MPLVCYKTILDTMVYISVLVTSLPHIQKPEGKDIFQLKKEVISNSRLFLEGMGSAEVSPSIKGISPVLGVYIKG